MLQALTGCFDEAWNDCNILDTCIVKNSTFDKDIRPWIFRDGAAKAKIAVINGEVRIEIIAKSKNEYDIQFLYETFALIKGKTYTFTFDAYASSPADTIKVFIGKATGDYKGVIWGDLPLTTEKQSFPIKFTYDCDACATIEKARIAFDCGWVKSQYIYLDNIYLCETNAPSSIEESSLSKCTVKIGENVFTVEGNSIEMITIYDVLGRVCYNKTYPSVEYAEINDVQLPSGVGLIQIRTDVKTAIVKKLK